MFEIAGFEIPNVIIRKVTRNAEGTKEKVQDSESSRYQAFEIEDVDCIYPEKRQEIIDDPRSI